MAEAILGEREVIRDPSNDKFGLVKVKTTVKVGDNDWPIVVTFAVSGLYVFDIFTDANMDMGFVCMRRSFGP